MVKTGLDVLLLQELSLLRGRRVGVVCHPASVNSKFVHIVDALCLAGIRPIRLFGPEHGVRGELQDMASVEGGTDPLTGIPVMSLYGNRIESLQPTQDSLRDLDVLVIDLQDVGSRYYTFIWTMALCLEVAASVGIQVLVLDRPNPINGSTIEGGEVRPSCESFVGMGSIPVRHGLTIGEVAHLIAAGIPWGGARFLKPLSVDLRVISMEGWSRNDYFDRTSLPWILPSPNMPSPDTALVYPGMCLLEASQISEGRGTTRPFEIFGAPFVDGSALASRLEALPGVRFRPLSFQPMFHKHANQRCGGIQLHVVDRHRFQPYRTGIAILRELRNLYPDQFLWRSERYEFVSDRPAIDLLTGSSTIREGIDRGATLEELCATFTTAEQAFVERRRPHLLYGSKL